MPDQSNSNILFVINPKAGSQKKDYESIIKSHPVAQQYQCHFFYLTEKESNETLEDKIKILQPKVITAVGGDGTISYVAKKILGTPIKLGIIPGGSANGMAKELNISEDINIALNNIEKGYFKKTDILYINNLLCLHLADIGLNARLIKYFEEGNIRGHWGYAKVALKVFFSQRFMRVNIVSDNKVIRKKAVMIVIANASKYGTGAVINPKGTPYDGVFEVVIIKQMGLMTLLKMWFKPLGLMPYHIEVIPAQEVTIQTHRKIHFQVDGEYIGKVQKINAYIVPGNLNIIIPEEQ